MTRVADVSFGRSKLMTGDTPSTSMPRAAMWVAMGSDAAPRARFRRLLRSSHDSSLEQAGFELVWGFSCQVVVLGFAESSLFGAGKPFFIPSPAIRFAERAEGVKGPKR